jgi:Zn-finger nucleic acid-binding protein
MQAFSQKPLGGDRMNCPVCNDVRMREVEKNGVHIDTCPECKGVWLDRGELDKLTAGIREVRQEYNNSYDNERNNDRNDSKSSDRYDSDNRNPKHKKKNSILDAFGDLF